MTRARLPEEVGPDDPLRLEAAPASNAWRPSAAQVEAAINEWLPEWADDSDCDGDDDLAFRAECLSAAEAALIAAEEVRLAERVRQEKVGVLFIEMRLHGVVARQLKAESVKRGREPVAVLADLIVAALKDDLVSAILDDSAEIKVGEPAEVPGGSR